MNKRYIYAGVGILILALLIFTIPKYFTGNVTASGTEISGALTQVDKKAPASGFSGFGVNQIKNDNAASTQVE